MTARREPSVGRSSARAAVRAPASREDALFARVVEIIASARTHVARATSSAMVLAYWSIGREIVEVEQAGARRASYGEDLLERLGARLSAQLGRGFSARTLRRIRQFYLVFPRGSSVLSAGKTEVVVAPSGRARTKIRSAPLTRSGGGEPGAFPANLGWTHYLILLGVEDPTARAFYEVEAAREGWSSRELERQVASLLFERLARSRDRKKVRALARHGHRLESPVDVIKDPFVLEFLGLDERPEWRERELEQAIIDRMERFLLELGKGFCFVARQKRLTLDRDHFFVDLVLYNRLLRCFVLVDLKLGKLTHQDLGQMQMYVNYFDRYQRVEHEAPTIGIVLCSDKNDAMARITLAEDNRRILAGRYQMYLPTEAQLRTELAREREGAERALRALPAATAPRRGRRP